VRRKILSPKPSFIICPFLSIICISVELVELLLGIRKVPGSDLGQTPVNLAEVVHGFLRACTRMSQIR
jgi:hypothetical protein